MSGSYTSWKDLLTRRLSGWANFAAAVRASEAVTVVDSTFLQSSVASMLRRNLEPDTILTYIERVADLVRFEELFERINSTPAPLGVRRRGAGRRSKFR